MKSYELAKANARQLDINVANKKLLALAYEQVLAATATATATATAPLVSSQAAARK